MLNRSLVALTVITFIIAVAIVTMFVVILTSTYGWCELITLGLLLIGLSFSSDETLRAYRNK